MTAQVGLFLALAACQGTDPVKPDPDPLPTPEIVEAAGAYWYHSDSTIEVGNDEYWTTEIRMSLAGDSSFTSSSSRWTQDGSTASQLVGNGHGSYTVRKDSVIFAYEPQGSIERGALSRSAAPIAPSRWRAVSITIGSFVLLRQP